MSKYKPGDAVWFVPREELFERGLGTESRFGRLAVIVSQPTNQEKWNYWLRFEYKTAALIGAKEHELAPLKEGSCGDFDHLRADWLEQTKG